ncbi:hypothetical protein E4U43_001003 [Claviceps pusilla]|uniref:DUF7898 domain-containing protein n=1 Tax=Claviceps pusilla TaxID=123648 RepID=A0A9P7SZN6_9HYPO|nr:hypothetical protein E4U43_001003 [Claviceps pusilla]
MKTRADDKILHSRVFFDNGYRSVAALANANPKDLVPILMQVLTPTEAQPNKLRTKSQKDEMMEKKMLAKAEVISSAANRLWSMHTIKTLACLPPFCSPGN